MTRLQASVDPTRWVAVTESFGFRGRRHRKRAIRMLMGQLNRSLGVEARPGGGFAAWALSQAVPALMRRAAGRVLVWVWKDDPELVVVMASIQQATPQSRVARAMRPMEEDDTESFRHPTLGVGERLVLEHPSDGRPPFVTYSFDLTTHFVEVTAVGDDARLRTVLDDVDALVRELRVVEDMQLTESDTVLRLPPA